MTTETDELLANNIKAINIFYSDGNDVNKMSIFLFEMLALFTKIDPGYTEEYKVECVNNFEMLHTLVNDIVPVDCTSKK